VWPVGLACDQRYESPLINVKTGSVIGWVTCKKRFYATDMAGFSVNTKLILSKPEARFNMFLKPGQQETDFLRQLISGLSSLEPKAKNCSEVNISCENSVLR
jgi:Glycosyltransferase family 43